MFSEIYKHEVLSHFCLHMKRNLPSPVRLSANWLSQKCLAAPVLCLPPPSPPFLTTTPQPTHPTNCHILRRKNWSKFYIFFISEFQTLQWQNLNKCDFILLPRPVIDAKFALNLGGKRKGLTAISVALLLSRKENILEFFWGGQTPWRWPEFPKLT